MQVRKRNTTSPERTVFGIPMCSSATYAKPNTDYSEHSNPAYVSVETWGLPEIFHSILGDNGSHCMNVYTLVWKFEKAWQAHPQCGWEFFFASMCGWSLNIRNCCGCWVYNVLHSTRSHNLFARDRLPWRCFVRSQQLYIFNGNMWSEQWLFSIE